jgi:hypothetical protein
MSVWWYKGDGTKILISEMSDSHLSNAIRKFESMSEIKNNQKVDTVWRSRWKGKSYTEWLTLLKTEQDLRQQIKSETPPAQFEEEYRWAVNHPNNKDAIAFLSLPWGATNFDQVEATILAGSIQEKMASRDARDNGDHDAKESVRRPSSMKTRAAPALISTTWHSRC